ncbi:protein LHY [Coffea eugenioides]|uniref:protein LHY n=1 Tax=Coffea eugenioides TaxID=49369 RepID=UPI000F60FECC|nr:protein LHY [Coffea eugenioides]XP_027159706.1 protein LHY [Coffea eugenioides]XP_027159707.1 protein LHY [Coffea eugenioides]
MDTYSSGEELIIKARKPYTITKQRERWTEEEHNRFLEALKLYGRAWQRIEEHIGTKTAVQIRSHAQKFFTKLEKEALAKGTPIGQALDIEIPPPRPKRKPCNPYPRKMSIGLPTSQVESKDGKLGNPSSSLPQAEHILDLEKEPAAEKPEGEKFEDAKENHDEGESNKCFNLLQASPGISPSSANTCSSTMASGKSSVLKEFVPIFNEVVNRDETIESYVTVEAGPNQNSDKFYTIQSFEENGTCNSRNWANAHSLNDKPAQNKGNVPEQSENIDTSPKNGVQSPKSQPRHVAVHILDGSLRMNAPNVSAHMPYEESSFHEIGGVNSNIFSTLSSSATSQHQSSASRFSISQPFVGFNPIWTPVHQEDYHSFLHASSTFSNLIVSALLQNPTAHAAGSFAASLWPCSTTEAPVESPGGSTGGFTARQMNAAPSITSIAAATVAAATAWWTAHGLLPLCAPFHMGLNYVPVSGSAVPAVTNQPRVDITERREEISGPPLDAKHLEPEFSEALQEQHSTSKSPTLSLSDSEESKGLNSSNKSTAKKTDSAAVTDVNDSNKPKGRKRVDRSSCGSNTPSSSEVETDALEKLEKGKEELREPVVSQPIADSSGRRSRSSSSTSDSWKEVSEEGRLAFQALFSREVLPQSFSPPHDSKNKGKNTNEKNKDNADEKGDEGYLLDLNGKMCMNSAIHQELENNSSLRCLNITEGGLLTTGKLKVRRTGFKPYKRCSVEAKENRLVCAGSQEEEKGTKRIRLEGEASYSLNMQHR